MRISSPSLNSCSTLVNGLEILDLKQLFHVATEGGSERSGSLNCGMSTVWEDLHLGLMEFLGGVLLFRYLF